MYIGSFGVDYVDTPNGLGLCAHGRTFVDWAPNKGKGKAARVNLVDEDIFGGSTSSRWNVS